MKKILFLLSILILQSACTTHKGFNKISFINITSNQYRQQKNKYVLYIPSNYKFERIVAGGESGIEDKYIYTDLSVLYISDFGASPNDNNIRDQGYGSLKFEFKSKDAIKKDTLNLSGKSIDGFFWKEISIDKVSFGYTNVPPEKKELFDKALQSIHLK